MREQLVSQRFVYGFDRDVVAGSGPSAAELLDEDADNGAAIQPYAMRVGADEARIVRTEAEAVLLELLRQQQRAARAAWLIGSCWPKHRFPYLTPVMVDNSQLLDRRTWTTVAPVGKFDRVKQRHAVVAAEHRRVGIALPPCWPSTDQPIRVESNVEVRGPPTARSTARRRVDSALA